MIVNSVQPWHILLQSAGICWDTAYWLVIKTILKNHPSGVPLWWLQLPRMSQKNGACCTGWTLIWHVGHWTGEKKTDIHFLPAFLKHPTSNRETQLSKSRDKWWCPPKTVLGVSSPDSAPSPHLGSLRHRGTLPPPCTLQCLVSRGVCGALRRGGTSDISGWFWPGRRQILVYLVMRKRSEWEWQLCQHTEERKKKNQNSGEE